MPETVDILVVGAGPAGLAAGVACSRHRSNFLVAESGQPLDRRDHEDQVNLTTGVGGCGLYSDGKFSFFPSATQLWQLRTRAALAASYE